MRKIKRPKIGQYVLVAKWSDKDPQDPWRVGFVTALIITKDAIRYKVDDDLREYKHCWSISKKEGEAWLQAHLTTRALDEAPRGCEHKNMLPSEPHGFLYCPDCGLRQ